MIQTKRWRWIYGTSLNIQSKRWRFPQTSRIVITLAWRPLREQSTYNSHASFHMIVPHLMSQWYPDAPFQPSRFTSQHPPIFPNKTLLLQQNTTPPTKKNRENKIYNWIRWCVASVYVKVRVDWHTSMRLYLVFNKWFTELTFHPFDLIRVDFTLSALQTILSDRNQWICIILESLSLWHLID